MTNLTNYWNLTISEQNQIKDNNPTQPLKTYRVSGRLNLQSGIEATGGLVSEIIKAYHKFDAIDRIEKAMVKVWFNSERHQDLIECYGLNTSWLNERVLVETLIVSDRGDYWIEE